MPEIVIINIADEASTKVVEVQKQESPRPSPEFKVGLLTGCKDKPYVFGLTLALAAKGVFIDIVGSDDLDCPEMHTVANLCFRNFYGRHDPKSSLARRLSKLLTYYLLLIRYAAFSSPKILHILWNNKVELFDRTILMFYYKLLGKRILFTAHNVNQGKRDAKDSWLNRITLNIQYSLCDHIFVHTPRMKEELCTHFAVAEDAVSVISFPINNALPDTELTPAAAKQQLGLASDEKIILFFGRIRPYKGIEHLLDALRLLNRNDENYRLIIAGEPIKGCEEYLEQLRNSLGGAFRKDQIIWRTQFIPDADVEMYLKAADILVLPYREIFQSGVLFLAYAFGLPVVATDVGSFREDIVEGRTGFVCHPEHPEDMAKAIERYFASDLFRNLDVRRQEIKDYANSHHSWQAVADATCKVYLKILDRYSSHVD